MNEKYILYGTGIEAENFLFQNMGIKRNIVFCFDREKKEKFHDLEVFQFDKDYIWEEKYKIIVAAGNKKTFDEIAHILSRVGMKEWENFIWSKTFNKKVVLINANCHGTAIQRYLEQSNTFCNEYFIYPVPAVHLNKDKELSKDLIKNVDVFIHQDIKPDNSISYKLSDEYIRKYLPLTVLDICIPNFVGMGKWMFPNLGGLDKILETAAGCRHITFRDYVLDEATKCCNTLEEYKTFWNNYFYAEEELHENYRNTIIKMKDREKNWDIKIVDYIQERYKFIPCFADANHPSKYVMKEVGRQVADLMGISDIDESIYDCEIGIPVPIIQTVYKAYGFGFTEKKQEIRKWFGKKVVSEVDDYITAYLWWYHDIVIN